MVKVIDLRFQGRPGAVAAGLVEGPGGVVVVDPGPATCLPALSSALADRGRSLDDLAAVLVTHIHLDHSGAAGLIARANPRTRFYVHRRGARHLVDPSRLVSSAGRLYGEALEPLWGEVLPVPQDRTHALDGGETLRVAGLEFRVADTPGHAPHHLSFLEVDSGTACAGDVGGLRVGPPLLVLPPTPPPDIDVEAWQASLGRLRAWSPRALFITHFGSYPDVPAHLADLERHLLEMAASVRALLEDASLDEAQRVERFGAWMRGMCAAQLPGPEWVARYATAETVSHCWQGLSRYWRRRQAAVITP
jgi:glyoxylase-like metal-dependent hydrolase (beta-lactamase superfamily II)